MTAEDRMEKALRCIMIGAVVFVALMFAVVAALAHDHNKPSLDNWYLGLKSGNGPCCGGPSVDATTLDGPDWEARDGRYRVRLQGVWYDVPPESVLNEPNMDGRTLVWPMWSDGEVFVRCFMPGAMI